MRLAGLYALERLAQNNPAQRQTIVNLLCAYLRMPYVPPGDAAEAREDAGALRGDRDPNVATAPTSPPQRSGGDFYNSPAMLAREELQVRLTAQRLLATHLRPGDDPNRPHDTFWPEIADVDLTDAYLHDLDMTGCHLPPAQFTGACFAGITGFDVSSFTHTASFDRASFTGTARFVEATFTGDAGFHRTSFTGSAYFVRTNFAATAEFYRASFTGSATFARASFAGTAVFDGASFADDAEFDRASFADNAEFDRASFACSATFDEASFKGPAWLLGANFVGPVSLTEARGRDAQASTWDAQASQWPAGWTLSGGADADEEGLRPLVRVTDGGWRQRPSGTSLEPT